MSKWLAPATHIEPLSDGALLTIFRERLRSGSREVVDSLRIGPNEVHAFVTHEDGSIWDLGLTHNLLHTDGRDLSAAALGAPGFGVTGTVGTGSSATSITGTGFAATDAWKGWTVVAEEGTNAPVYGNIGTNSTTVITVDAWRTGDDTAGTTPGTTANFFVMPTCRPRFMGLTENSSSPAAGDTVLTGEITTGGCARALCTYAHTNDAATYTMQKAFSVTAPFPAIHRIALLTASTVAAGGVAVFGANLNTDANVINGDTLTVTDTITLS